MISAFPIVINGDPDMVGRLAAHFRQICDVMTTSRDRVHAARSDSVNWTWYGQAAEAFRGKLSDLPGQLDKAVASYDEMAWCLWRYENTLRGLQEQLLPVGQRWLTASRNLETIQTQRAASANPHDASWDQKEQAAQSDIDHALADGNRLHDEFDTAVSQTTHAIDQASSKGIQPDSWWSGFTNDLGAIAGVVGSIAVDVGKALVQIAKECVDLPRALAAFIQDPSWSSFNTLITDVGAVLMVASIVIGVGAFMPALAEALLTARGAMEVANLANSALTIAGDAGSGKGWPALAIDVVSLGAGGVASGTKLSMALGRPGEDSWIAALGNKATSVDTFNESPWMTDGTHVVNSTVPSLSRWHGLDGRFVSTPEVAQVSARYSNLHTINSVAGSVKTAARYGHQANQLAGDAMNPSQRNVDQITHDVTNDVVKDLGTKMAKAP